MKLRSFAKVNIGLEIKGIMPNGYHRIKTIFQSIDLFDTLYFEEIESGIVLKGNREDILWNEENLIFKAAKRFMEEFKISKGIRIFVEKRIPPGSGLGGGSSNAGCTLIALKEIFCKELNSKMLLPIASEIGADVPYFLFGGTCIGEGKGDVIREIEDFEPLYFFIVFPKIQISTKYAYREWDRAQLTFPRKKSNINRLVRDRNFRSLKNDLEEVVLMENRELKEIKKRLLNKDFDLVMMSGSGSCIYGLTKDPMIAENARKDFLNYHVEIVRSISREEYWKRLFIK